MTTPNPKKFKHLEWSNAISLNNEKIDTQHKHLYTLTNRLITESETNPEVLNDTIYELLQYVEQHFSEEETQLAKRGYPQLEAHKKIHRTFSRKMAMFCKDDLEGNPEIVQKLTEYMIFWVENHIEKTDQEYKDYI